MYYKFNWQQNGDADRGEKFCRANNIDPRRVIHGSDFQVDGRMLTTLEFEVSPGGGRIWHEGCCGSSHYAKHTVKREITVMPEEFGFEPLRMADGTVAP